MQEQSKAVAAWEKVERLVTSDTDEGRLVRLGATVVALCGAVLTGAAVARARMRRSSGPRVVGFAALAASVLGVIAIGDRILRRSSARSEEKAVEESKASENERFSHPAINVQRISFA